jgi:hypothetical protein
VPVQQLPIFTEDVRNLITARIPIFVDKPGAAGVTLPLILALEGPPGMKDKGGKEKKRKEKKRKKA